MAARKTNARRKPRAATTRKTAVAKAALKKQKDIWSYAGYALGAATIGYSLYLMLWPKVKAQQQLPDPNNEGGSNTVVEPSMVWPIKFGVSGEHVREFQRKLIELEGGNILPVYGADGEWGSETQTAWNAVYDKMTIFIQPFFNTNSLSKIQYETFLRL